MPHTYRKTVATMLDRQGLSARTIADQLGHSRISMTQDVYMGRRAVDQVAVVALESLLPGGGDRADEAAASAPSAVIRGAADPERRDSIVTACGRRVALRVAVKVRSH